MGTSLPLCRGRVTAPPPLLLRSSAAAATDRDPSARCPRPPLLRPRLHRPPSTPSSTTTAAAATGTETPLSLRISTQFRPLLVPLRVPIFLKPPQRERNAPDFPRPPPLHPPGLGTLASSPRCLPSLSSVPIVFVFPTDVDPPPRSTEPRDRNTTVCNVCLLMFFWRGGGGDHHLRRFLNRVQTVMSASSP